MKIIYSHLKNLLPDLNKDPKTVRDDLTLIGHFVSGYQEVENDVVMDLEVRQNRGDCLGYYGVAKDLAVFYKLDLKLPTNEIPKSESDYQLPISITAVNDVKRVMAVKISNISVSESPLWLKKFLEYHNINSINNIVDLTNYAMLIFGIPNHAFDIQKTSDALIWELNSKFKSFTTLDGTKLNLSNKNLIISNKDEPVSLSFIGGQNSGISTDTKDILVEMAIYNPSRVRQDSRQLKTITEASIRLDKYLDTELIPQAFSFLVNEIIKISGGQVASSIYDNYLVKPQLAQITFDPTKPSDFAGIEIPTNFASDVLVRLDSQIKVNDGVYQVTPPSLRKDINLEEDLIEEVIRFWGYNKIPLDQPISSSQLPDITPPILYLNEALKNILISLGYDEVRSWPLIREKSQIKITKNQHLPIYTQNSINSEYPVLRQTIISSLIEQQDQYQRFKLPTQIFFEIGKVYNKTKDSSFQEHYALGIFHQSKNKLTADIETIWKKIGIPKPEHIEYQLKDGIFVEFDLEDLLKSVNVSSLLENHLFGPETPENSAFELTGQIITLDANVSLKEKRDPIDLITEYSQKIGDKVWQLEIADIYEDTTRNEYRYTFRASYFNTDDKTAKEIHLNAFGLK